MVLYVSVSYMSNWCCWTHACSFALFFPHPLCLQILYEISIVRNISACVYHPIHAHKRGVWVSYPALGIGSLPPAVKSRALLLKPLRWWK